MAKILQDYVKYTIKELNTYTQTEGSCVLKINTNLHISLGPHCLADFKHALLSHIIHRKVGYYDKKLDGIILDVKNIKVLGHTAAMRSDDPKIHVNIKADCYIFRPIVGAVLDGIVKHIGNHHVGVIIYRVFNANIRFEHKLNEEDVQMDQVVKFRIKKFNLQNVFPYIEGDLQAEVKEKKNKVIKFDADFNDSTVDSGIEEKDGVQELDELVELIKTEPEVDLTTPPSKEKSSKKSKRKSNAAAAAIETNEDIFVKPKQEPLSNLSELATPSKKKRSKKSAKADDTVLEPQQNTHESSDISELFTKIKEESLSDQEEFIAIPSKSK